MTNEPTTPCVLHEEQIRELSRKTEELKAKNGFKQQRISELIEDNRRIESKIDKLTDTVNNVVVNSIKDDKDLKEGITELKVKVEAQEKNFEKFEEKQQKQRDDDRAKTNQYLSYITVGLAVLSFILTCIFK